MTEETENWREGLGQKVLDEIDCVVKAFRGSSDRRPEIKAARNDGGVDHLYVEGQILVRPEYLDRVLEILGQPAERDLVNAPDRLRRLAGGVALVTLADPQPTVQEALAEIDRQLGRGIATPDHVLTVAPGEGLCLPGHRASAGLRRASSHTRRLRGDNGGAGVLIYLADTGLLDRRGHGASAGWPGYKPATSIRCRQCCRAECSRSRPTPATARLSPESCARMAPAAEIVVCNAFSIAGSQLESDLVTRLEDELRPRRRHLPPERCGPFPA